MEWASKETIENLIGRYEFIRQFYGEKAMNDAIYGSRVEKLMDKLKNTDKMGKQTIYTVPEGIEVEKFEFDGNNFVVTVKDKEVFAPKDGDVCVCTDFFGRVWSFIYMAQDKFHIYTHVTFSGGGLGFSNALAIINNPYMASEKTAAELFTAMEKAGYKWNAEEKRVEKIRWRAKVGGSYWYCSCDNNCGETYYSPCITIDANSAFDDAIYLQGDYHRTEADCQKLCDQLNATVKNFVA